MQVVYRGWAVNRPAARLWTSLVATGFSRPGAGNTARRPLSAGAPELLRRRMGRTGSVPRWPVVQDLILSLGSDLFVEELHDLVPAGQQAFDLLVRHVRLELFQRRRVQGAEFGQQAPVANHQVLLLLQGVVEPE